MKFPFRRKNKSAARLEVINHASRSIIGAPPVKKKGQRRNVDEQNGRGGVRREANVGNNKSKKQQMNGVLANFRRSLFLKKQKQKELQREQEEARLGQASPSTDPSSSFSIPQIIYEEDEEDDEKDTERDLTVLSSITILPSVEELEVVLHRLDHEEEPFDAPKEDPTITEMEQEQKQIQLEKQRRQQQLIQQQQKEDDEGDLRLTDHTLQTREASDTTVSSTSARETRTPVAEHAITVTTNTVTTNTGNTPKVYQRSNRSSLQQWDTEYTDTGITSATSGTYATSPNTVASSQQPKSVQTILGSAWECGTQLTHEMLLQDAMCSVVPNPTAKTTATNDLMSTHSTLSEDPTEQEYRNHQAQRQEELIEFVRRATRDGIPLLLHVPAEDGVSWTGRSIKLFLRWGNCISTSLSMPHLEWIPMDSNLGSTDEEEFNELNYPQKVDLLDIQNVFDNRILDETDGNADDMHFFSITTSRNGYVYLWEAGTPTERDWIVSSLQDLVSRLSFQIVTGHVPGILEWYSSSSMEKDPGELPALKSVDHTVNTISHQFLNHLK